MTATEPGVEVAAATVPPAWPVRWAARWIWYRTPPAATLVSAPALEEEHRDAVVLLRRRAVLDAVPDSLRTRITADGRYVLWVNGVEVSRGPIRSEPGMLFWDEPDLRAHLRRGENAIALLVRHYGAPTPWWLPTRGYAEMGRGGVVMEVEGLPELSTGAGWRVRRGPWTAMPQLFFGAPNENLDARQLPSGWRETDFDDSGWDEATLLAETTSWPGVNAGPPAAPFTRLEANPLAPQTDIRIGATPVARAVSTGDLEPAARLLLGVDPVHTRGGRFVAAEGPLSLPCDLGAGEALTLDLGGIAIGTPEVTVESDGAAVVLRSGEEMRDGAALDPHRSWAHRRVCRPGRDVVEPLEVAGMRYLTVTAEAPLRVLDVALRERRYPLDATGAFGSDDPVLDAIWRTCRRTLEVCATDAFLDCPAREQRAWLGDAYVHGLLTYATAADTRLARHVLRLAATSRRVDGTLGMIAAGDLSAGGITIPDYSLHFVRAVARAFEHTADLDLVEEMLPAMAGILDWFWSLTRDGVLDALPGWVFVDWAPLPYDGPSATLQGLLVTALDDHAALAEAAEQPRVASRSRRRATALRAGFGHFWDERRGLYVDDLRRGTVTQSGVAMAVLAGVAADPAALLERACEAATLRYAVETPQHPRSWDFPVDWDAKRHVLAAQPFFAHWLHQALAAAGRHDLLLDSIRRWAPFLDTGDGTVWEFWREHTRRGSRAHAWAATPAYDLSAFVLGVRPAAPGCAEVLVAPWFGPLRELRGTVPTPHGAVRVDLRRDGAGIAGSVELPPGVRGRFAPVEAPALHRELGPGLTVTGQT
ncbi:MAG TPA: alpha-L-rhamnosidase C-terminal domain-containing protein [Candidatus Dormibacteraeota bacterium]|nr:alpha-L-rhamnosidase C-terminal domain-containing protein [Candidatus Dormibacteraeota bacterium]